MADGLSGLPAVGQRDPEVEAGYHVVGIDFQGRLVMTDRLIDPSLAGQGHAKIVVDRAIPGHFLDRELKVFDGRVRSAQLHCQHAAVAMQAPVVGGFGECRLVG